MIHLDHFQTNIHDNTNIFSKNPQERKNFGGKELKIGHVSKKKRERERTKKTGNCTFLDALLVHITKICPSTRT